MKVLLLGEIDFTTKYYQGICELNSWKIDNFFYDQSISKLDPSYDIYILSDYPSSQLKNFVCEEIVEEVYNGKGLLMIGGWNSFSGIEGNYRDTKIGGILPVSCLAEDDRVNAWGGLHLRRIIQHWIVSDLDWRNPPIICGYNKVVPRKEAEIVIEAQGALVPDSPSVPMLALIRYGRGRVGSFMSDLVPHWCAGLVDWGDKRIKHKGLEFGHCYVAFVSRLIAWVAGKEEEFNWQTTAP